MILGFSKHFLRNYHKAPKWVKEAFDKQSQLLLQNLHHPSLRAKKYDETRNLWQARVNYTWRFYQGRRQCISHGRDQEPPKIRPGDCLKRL